MVESVLGTSPRSSILDTVMARGDGPKEDEMSLDEFIEMLPALIAECKENNKAFDTNNNPLEDPIQHLFERVRLEKSDWERFAFVDPGKSYTRNLVATDHETFTLLILCWTPGRASAIHDHPCDGCWLRVLQGNVRECRYAKEGDALVCTQDATYDHGVVFITDSQGYHKIENPSDTEPAVSLHLYSPPFDRCRVWLDEKRDVPCKTSMCNYSEYGVKV